MDSIDAHFIRRESRGTIPLITQGPKSGSPASDPQALARDRIVATVTARNAQEFRAMFAEAEQRTQRRN